LVIFIISTYGEGEPTDNAVKLVNFLKDEALELSDGGSTLPNLRFAVFCIGNSTYKNFNTIGKLVDQRLEDIGATRIGICGIDDEDKALEEDYITWKDELWLAAETQMGWQNGAGVHSADFELNISPELDAERIYLGELTESDLTGSRVGFQDPKMPFTSAVIKATDLFED
jgi:NADPH-ferrihemoprotein reductase